MTDVYSGTITGTGSESLGTADVSYTVTDAITVDLTFRADPVPEEFGLAPPLFAGTVVQNVTTVTKVTHDGKTSTSTFAKSLIEDVSGRESVRAGATLFSIASVVGTNSSESLYFNFSAIPTVRPVLLVGGSVTVAGISVPLQGALYAGVYVPPTLLYEWYSFSDFVHNASPLFNPSRFGSTLPPLLGWPSSTLIAGGADHPENSGALSPTEAAHASTLALLGNYMASSLPAAAGEHLQTLAAQASHTEQQLTVTHPHG